MSKFWEGDGRVNLKPVNPPLGTYPIRVRRAAARKLIEIFETDGYIHHSWVGGTAWVLQEYCRVMSVSYTLEKHVVNGKVAGWTSRRHNG